MLPVLVGVYLLLYVDILRTALYLGQALGVGVRKYKGPTLLALAGQYSVVCYKYR